MKKSLCALCTKGVYYLQRIPRSDLKYSKKEKAPLRFCATAVQGRWGKGGENKSNAPWKAKPMGMEMVTCALGGPSAPDPPSGTTQQRTWGEGESYAPR